ncbi:MAG: 50S ribosomal protein L17 [Ferrimicrobium sp.]|uniref:Large ribosomal subunit protein bL17 n=1 Tax=Ferrimicrobium acidiphilum TaxID=121039 RepID=A0ABV3XYX8_9ACTN|nr:50S ribosomal protein L17 [Ferrimicrobium sp.]MCL5972912.1 50S ribosomal protein L17 [Actinomycetota bacterium]
MVPGRPKRGNRLGSDASHQRAMLANLCASLIAAESILTTDAKARALRPVVEKLVTKAKKGDLHQRRQVIAFLRDEDATKKLFDEVGPRYSNRQGGYVRILKRGPRHGDGAPMVVIEFV